MPKTFAVSFISEGIFYQLGEPIDDADIKPFMLRYIEKPTPKRDPNEARHLDFQMNETYALDADGKRLGNVKREMAEMQREARIQQEIEESLINEPESQAVTDAIESEREKHAARVELDKASLNFLSKTSDAAQEYIAQTHDEDFDGAFREPSVSDVEASSQEVDETPTPSRAAVSESPQSSSNGAKKPKPASRNPTKSFVKRDGDFVAMSSTALIPGEAIYRKRPRSFGTPAKWIKYSQVKNQ
jgi:hypothetical protein